MSDAAAATRARPGGNLEGALFMMASMLGFVCNDTLIKTLAGEMPLFQAIFLRGLAATALLAGLAAAQGALVHRVAAEDRPRLGLRITAEVGATLCFLTALFHMPIANATAILMVLPLAVTLAAAWFLGEPVGWRRYSAILVGFLGVLVIVRPGGAGFNAFALLALAAVGFLVLRDLITRRFSHGMPSVFAALATSIAITAVGGGLALATGWVQPTTAHLVTLAAAAGCLVVGYVFGVMTMRVGEVGFVSPFRYTVLIWAIILGALVFDEFPDAFTLAGSAVVVGTGLYTLHREQRARRPAATGEGAAS